MGEVTLESAKAREDKESLSQASFHLAQALQMLADLTKTYESVKRDNQLADGLAVEKRDPPNFLEDTQAMLGSKKPPINSVDRKIAEVDEDYVAKLNQLLEEQKKIMAELAKMLATTPHAPPFHGLAGIRWVHAARPNDPPGPAPAELLTKKTAEWTVADETARSALASRDLIAQASEQIEVASSAAKMHENVITWLPDGVEQDKESVATALALAAEGAAWRLWPPARPPRTTSPTASSPPARPSTSSASCTIFARHGRRRRHPEPERLRRQPLE